MIDALARLRTIPCEDPRLTRENWCRHQPCRLVRVGRRDLLISQPLSSVLVYLLGLLTAGIGVGFLVLAGRRPAWWLWGTALLLWGIGALLAGTSYQAFGYHIKSRNPGVCQWTSWWEVIYLLLQQASVNCMLAAIAYRNTEGLLRIALIAYAAINTLVYAVATLYGATVPIKKLITFERMVASCVAPFAICVGLIVWSYLTLPNRMDGVLLLTYAGVVLSMVAYRTYDRRGVTERLWARGRWFSQNDVLHVALIGCMLFNGLFLMPGLLP